MFGERASGGTKSMIDASQVGMWIVDGPRSLLDPADPKGAINGWYETAVKWRMIVPRKLACSWMLFRLQFKPAYPCRPELLLRIVSWDVTPRDPLDIAVEYSVVSDSVLKDIASAVSKLEDGRLFCETDAPGEIAMFGNAFYDWWFPAEQCNCHMNWTGNRNKLSSSWAMSLDRTIKAKAAPIDRSCVLERYSIDPLDLLIDFTGDQLSQAVSILSQLMDEETGDGEMENSTF
jgi:hypothetical protein